MKGRGGQLSIPRCHGGGTGLCTTHRMRARQKDSAQSQDLAGNLWQLKAWGKHGLWPRVDAGPEAWRGRPRGCEGLGRA